MLSEPAASAVELLAAAVDGLAEVDLGGLESEALLRLVGDLEVQSRRLAAQVDRVVDVVDATEAYRVDGHLSARAAIVHLTRVSSREAHGRVQVARALRELAVLAEAYRGGKVPVGAVRMVAQVRANPRVRTLVDDSDAWFTEQAATLSFEDLRQVVRTWEELADQDGAERRHERDHARRQVSFTQLFGGPFRLFGSVGALQGAWMADALFAIFRIAGSMDGNGVPLNDPVMNVTVDEVTFERAMAAAAGAHPAPRDPRDATTVQAHTRSGFHLGLLDVAELAFVGHVRRAVYNRRGVIIDLGRKERLFRGHAREAVLLGGWPPTRLACAWSGCDCPVNRLEIDHLLSHGQGGPTSPWNGSPKCGRHNRLKEAGYIIRYHRGRAVDHLRPDRTPITASV